MQKFVNLIGIGGSAGSIEILKKIIPQFKKDDNLSLVIVIHTTDKSNLADYLALLTPFDVVTVNTTVVIKPNTIYVNKPGCSIVIDKNRLKPLKSRYVMDKFFFSLAETYQENAVGVLLSATGKDGLFGLEAIQKAGGLGAVINPSEVKFDELINEAIKKDLVDIVIDTKNFRDKILNYFKDDEKKEIISNLHTIFSVLKEKSSIDFRYFKEELIIDKIANRLKILDIDIKNYINLLSTSQKEIEKLIDMLLIKVTSFFRDKESFDKLKEIIKSQKKDNFKVWVSACSSGEEAYSIAFMLEDLKVDYKIFATDVNEKALDIARKALYKESEIIDIDHFEKYFEKKGELWKVKDEIREKIIFAKHNLLEDKPFLNMDLISCRNFFIYLKKESQEKVLEKFHFSLKNEGILFLGKNETISNNIYFECIDCKNKIYVNLKKDIFHSIPLQILYESDNENFNYILFDKEFNIKKLSGNFENITHNNSNNLKEFLDDKLFNLIINLISEKKGKIVNINGKFYLLKVVSFNGEYLAIFEEIENFDKEVEELKKEFLEEKRKIEELIEQLDKKNEIIISKNEEVLALNEELKASNEELQAANEELTFANEELQRNYAKLKKEEAKAKEYALELEKKNYAIKLLKDEIEKQKDFLQKILDIQQEIIFVIDKNKIIYKNKSFEEFFNDIENLEDLLDKYPAFNGCLENNEFSLEINQKFFRCKKSKIHNFLVFELIDESELVIKNKKIENLLQEVSNQNKCYLRFLRDFYNLTGYNEIYEKVYFKFKRYLTKMMFLFKELNDIKENKQKEKEFEFYKNELIKLLKVLNMFNQKILDINKILNIYGEFFNIKINSEDIKYEDKEGYLWFLLILFLNIVSKDNIKEINLKKDEKGFYLSIDLINPDECKKEDNFFNTFENLLKSYNGTFDKNKCEVFIKWN